MQLFSVFTVLRFRSYEAKCVVLLLGCFRRGSTSLHSNFTWTESFPATILGIRKLETLGYPAARKPHHSASLRFDTYRGVTDRRTDRWTDLP